MPFLLISAMSIFPELTLQLLQLKFPIGKNQMKSENVIINFLKIIIRYWQGFLRKFLEKTFPSLYIQRSRSQFVHRFLTPKAIELIKVIYNNHLASIII